MERQYTTLLSNADSIVNADNACLDDVQFDTDKNVNISNDGNLNNGKDLPATKAVVTMDHIDSIADAFSDVNEMQFDDGENSNVQNNESLMPDLRDSENPSPAEVVTAQEQFSLVFAKRYSTQGLIFYHGALDEAIARMFALNSRPLILCIHNDQSVAAHVFCEQVLCTETITNYLAENFVVWPWDRTSETNYNG
ncbi:unnamed protein product [Rotaria sordida]|uniref:Fas-associated factor 1/2-like UAS domain-containing protein n=1 Tax=Rotaria sordida TaxID=392033 RepID=A0A814EHA2_9BILA|nr:unnamed protein product [Rotaria sordida]